jgi:hypothetical protein
MNGVKSLFMFLFAILMSLTESAQMFTHLKNRLVVVLSFENFLYILDTGILADI